MPAPRPLLTSEHLVTHSLASLSGSSGGTIRKWDVKTQTCVRTLSTTQSSAVNSLRVSGDRLYCSHGGSTAGMPGFVQVRDLQSGNSLHLVVTPSLAARELFIHNGYCYVATGYDIGILQASSMRQVRVLNHEDKLADPRGTCISAMRVMKESTGDLVCSIDGVLWLWDWQRHWATQACASAEENTSMSDVYIHNRKAVLACDGVVEKGARCEY